MRLKYGKVTAVSFLISAQQGPKPKPFEKAHERHQKDLEVAMAIIKNLQAENEYVFFFFCSCF